MNLIDNLNDPFIAWVVIPLLIITARILDVSIGTIRIIFVSKGYKSLAPILGFFEVLIWIAAAGQVMKNLNNFYYYIAWGIGFAVGNWIGMVIENKLSLGDVILRIITNKQSVQMIEYLRKNNYILTVFDGEGSSGEVKLIFMVILRQNLKSVITIIKGFDENAFYTVEDIKMVSGGAYSKIEPDPIYKKLISTKKSTESRK
jgi:uncharacterized protein YebE (UPF0316 family)